MLQGDGDVCHHHSTHAMLRSLPAILLCTALSCLELASGSLIFLEERQLCETCTMTPPIAHRGSDAF